MSLLSQSVNHLLTPRRLILYGGLLVANIVLFSSTDPINSSAFLVITGFVLAALDLLLITYIGVRLLGAIFPQVTPHQRRLTGVIGGFWIVLLGLASMGQLTWHDLLVVVVVGAVGYFYSLYFRLRLNRKQGEQ